MPILSNGGFFRNAGGGGGGTDPNFSSVVLLMGFENGVDGSSTFDDESNSNHTILVSGQAQIDTAQFKYGTRSLLLDGAGDRIAAADHADFNLAAVAFTVECWIRPNSVAGTRFLIGQWQAGPNLGWIMYMNGAALAWNVSTTGSNNLADLSGGTISAAGVWQHVAIDFDGTKYRAFLGGVMVASSTTLRTIFNSTEVLSVGSNSGVTAFFYDGWMDEVRITKGVSRYGSDSSFTPPTAAFPRS